MILPNKYITLSESLIGISSLILDTLSNKKMTIDELWSTFSYSIKQNTRIKSKPSYNKFVLAINFMYMTDMINYTNNGVLYNENFKLKNI